jgi:colicin import membrane protein
MEALRNKIQQLEKKEAATQRQMEVVQRRFDRHECDRKVERYEQEVQALREKGEIQARCDKLEAKAEMDKRDAQARCDKLEAKAKMDKVQHELKAEMDTRDVQARCAKLEAKSEMDKRDAQHELKAEMDKRDVQARCDKLEAKAEMDICKRDAQAQLEKGEAKARYDKLEMKAEMVKDMLQQQIAQLKWEARSGHAPQVVYSGPPPPLGAPPPPAVAPPVAPPSYIIQQSHQPSVNPAVPQASPPLQQALPKEIQGVASGAKKEAAEKPSSEMAVNTLPPSPADVATAHVASVVTPAEKSVTLSSQQHQKPPLTALKHPPLQQQPSSRPMHSTNAPKPAPVRQVLQQSHHISNNKVPARSAGVGAVLLPGDAQSHFFLSHAQGTGGDQTNAIYLELELQQLGFTCWYALVSIYYYYYY